MKKVYYAPLITVTEVVLEQGFLMDSAHGSSHTRVRDKKRLVKVSNLVKNSYLYR